jgi:diphosphomevalonate decarboxylase
MKATAQAYANIALVKYWGKRDSHLNIPAAGSISMTLNDLFTRTAVRFDADLEHDRLILNGSRASSEQETRVSRFLDLFRHKAGVETYAEVTSENNFPTGAGLASSASAFAALTMAAGHALGLQLSPVELSKLARRGSGSAARSVFGGFVEMYPGEEIDGSDAYAVPLYPQDYWSLELLIFVTAEQTKAVGSTEGMNRTANTSPFYRGWLESNQQDLAALRSALDRKDFPLLGETAESNCLKMHGLAMSANPGIVYWNSLTVTLIHEVRRLRETGVPAYFTIDAGPQVKVLCPPGYAGKIKEELGNIDGIKQVMITRPGPGCTVLSNEQRVMSHAPGLPKIDV